MKTIVLVVSLVAAVVWPSHAAILTWTGGGTDNNWSTPGNWLPAAAPQPGDYLAFPAGAARLSNTNNLSGIAFNSISVTGDSYTFSGNPVFLTNGLVAAQTGVLTINLDLNLGGSAYITLLNGGDVNLYGNVALNGHDLQLDVSATSGFLNLNGLITGDANYITKTGPGIVLFTGAGPNTFNATLWVQQGLVELSKSMDAVSGPLTIGNFGSTDSATVQLGTNDQINDSVTVTLQGDSILDANGWDDTIGSLNLINGSVQTEAGHLTLSGAVQANWSGIGNLPSLNGNIVLNSQIPFTGSFLYANGPISGAGAPVVNGLQLILKNANTFDGSLTINSGGYVEVANDQGLSPSASPVILNTGGTLSLDVNYSGKSLQINGSSNTLVRGYGNITWSGPINLNFPAGTATFMADGGGNLTLSGPISGTGGLAFEAVQDGDLLLLTGSDPNTYAGDTVVLSGTLNVSKSANVIAVPGNLVIGPPASGHTTAFARLYQYGGMGGSTVTVNQGSLYDLNGYGQDLSQLNLNDGGSVQTGPAPLYLNGGATVSVGSLSPAGSHAGSTIAGSITLPTGQSVTFFVNPFALSPPYASGPELDIPAVISGAPSTFFNALVKTGSGELRLSGTNTFPVEVDINDGTVIADNAGSLGTSDGGVSVNNTGSLALENNVTFNNEPLLLDSVNSAALDSRIGSNAWTGPVTLDATSGIRVAPASGYLQILNTVNGAGGLTKNGPGTLQFWGFTPNTYTGLTTVAEGTIDAGRVNLIAIPGDAAIGDDSTDTVTATLQLDREQQMDPGANVVVHRSGYLHLYDFPSVPPPHQPLRTLTGSGQVGIDSQAQLTISNDAPFAFDGSFSGGAFFGTNINLIKTGPGTMTLSSQSSGSAFYGRGVLAAGELQVDGTFGTLAMDVKPNARLTGGGQLNGVTIEQSGVIAVNPTSPGLQGGNFALAGLQATNGSTVELDFFGPYPTGGNDAISSVSAAVLNNATLSASFEYPPRDGDVLTLINNTLSGAVSGTFNGWPQGAVQTLNGIPCRISYTGGDGNDVTLTVTNLALEYSSYQLEAGNGNQTVEPDECNLLYVSLLNQRATPVTITNAVLRATTANAVVTIASASYPTIPPGSAAANLTPFQFRTDPDMGCGDPVSFELMLGVANEGTFAVSFSPVSGTDCSHPTGPCESCNVVSGQFTTNTPMTTQRLYFVGAPSLCYPAKAYPGINPNTNLPPFALMAHSFTNSTTNTLCITAQLDFDCPSAPTNALGVAAYLGSYDTNHPSTGYLGDIGAGGPPYPPFSFQVPAGSNFVLAVMARTTNLVCHSYALEVFGLPCLPPTIAIEHEPAPDKVRVDWSTAYPGWTAQQAGRLGGGFSNVVQTPAILSGRYTLTNITANTNRFYRLTK